MKRVVVALEPSGQTGRRRHSPPDQNNSIRFLWDPATIAVGTTLRFAHQPEMIAVEEAVDRR